jgi:mannitol/fructose-specific phosphotransferase system IIA component (Ntr-type)
LTLVAIRVALNGRESPGTTAIGGGIALPHAKHEAVARPLLAVALLE